MYLGALPWDVLEDIVKHRQNWDVRSATGKKGVRTVQGVRLHIKDARKPPQNTLVLDADELEAPLPSLRGERALYLAARGVASEAVLQAGKVHAFAPRRAVVATLAEALEMAEHPVVILASSRPAADLVRNELRPGDVVTKLNLSHDENGDEKSRDIMKIVNAHHQSLAYLSAQASKIEAEVVKLERANEAERRAQAV